MQRKNVYFNHLKIHKVTDNKTFWTKVKPFFSETVNLKTKITLVKKGSALCDPEISLDVEKVISYDGNYWNI